MRRGGGQLRTEPAQSSRPGQVLIQSHAGPAAGPALCGGDGGVSRFASVGSDCSLRIWDHVGSLSLRSSLCRLSSVHCTLHSDLFLCALHHALFSTRSSCALPSVDSFGFTLNSALALLMSFCSLCALFIRPHPPAESLIKKREVGRGRGRAG